MGAKKKFIAEGGVEVTDQLVEELAELWENGNPPGEPGPFVAGPGRPPLYQDELKTITVKLPASVIAVIDSKAHALGESRSQYVRKTLMADIL